MVVTSAGLGVTDPIVPVGGGVPVDAETGERFGYLPPRAARRKLIVRRQLGIAWVVSALAAALVILLVGLQLLSRTPSAPGAPFVDEGPLAAYPAGHVTPLRDGSGWLDRRDGLVAVAAPLAFCPSDGSWVAPGRRFTTDAPRLPVRAVHGHVYVDPTTRLQQPPAGPPITTSCPDAQELPP